MVDVWRYPVNWPAISRRIRERDGQRCRWCGAGEYLFDLVSGKPILLTTMHLDGDPMNCEESIRGSEIQPDSRPGTSGSLFDCDLTSQVFELAQRDCPTDGHYDLSLEPTHLVRGGGIVRT
jgi:hypothetical protein